MVMDPLTSPLDTKKRKLEENNNSNGVVPSMLPCEPTLATEESPTYAKNLTNNHNVADARTPSYLSRPDVRLMVDLLSKEDLAHLLVEASLLHIDVLDGVRELADRDPAHRKIFVRGLGWETDTVSLRDTFSEFGELEEAIAIMDRNTGMSYFMRKLPSLFIMLRKLEFVEDDHKYMFFY